MPGARARRRRPAGTGTRWRRAAPSRTGGTAGSRRGGTGGSHRGRRWKDRARHARRGHRRGPRGSAPGAIPAAEPSRASPVAGSTMAMSSPSSAAPRAHSAQASVDLPDSPRPASRMPRPSRAISAPCTSSAAVSRSAQTAPVSTTVTACSALGDRLSPPADERTRHAALGAVVADAIHPPGLDRSIVDLIAGGPRLEDGARPQPHGRIVGGEFEAQGTGLPANDSAGRRRRHEAGTMAPCRVSSSRNADTSRSASSRVSSGNCSRRAAMRS